MLRSGRSMSVVELGQSGKRRRINTSANFLELLVERRTRTMTSSATGQDFAADESILSGCQCRRRYGSKNINCANSQAALPEPISTWREIESRDLTPAMALPSDITLCRSVRRHSRGPPSIRPWRAGSRLPRNSPLSARPSKAPPRVTAPSGVVWQATTAIQSA